MPQFEAELFSPEKPGEDENWAFCLIPKRVSDTLPRRGRTTVVAMVNGRSFQATLEPDGRLSHWLKIDKELQKSLEIEVGDTLSMDLSPVDPEPDPEVPADLRTALLAAPNAQKTWDSTTAVARVDWIHWVVSAKQTKTREKRIRDACDMLAEGKKRVCCFDPSGFYSKAFRAPTPSITNNG